MLRNHKAFGAAIEKLYSKSLHKQVEKNRCTFDFSETSIKCLKQKTATRKKKSICSQKNHFGSKDLVDDHSFSRSNAAFNSTHEHIG